TAFAASSPAPASTAAGSAGPGAVAPGTLPAAPKATVPLTGPVDVERVMAHVKVLSVGIGLRDSGSDGEQRAARYVADVLTAQGYAATVETFTYRARYDDSTVKAGTAEAIRGFLLDGAASGRASGVLVDGGLGQPDQIAAVPARGAVVLLRRGGLPFAQKVANAQQAGAVGILIVNSEPGPFRGMLGQQRASIPALAIDGSRWEALQAALGQTVEVEGSAGTRSVTSQNVLGRRGDTCRAYIGAHYDSVPAGPGANDNATGTAALVEIARVRATDGLCAVAFGSEETGLNGSQAFVTGNGVRDAKFMVNFDMMGRIDGAMIVGDAGLTEEILGIIGRGPEQPLRAGSFPPFASSDHVSFSSVGVPAVTITSGDDPAIHAARDTFEAVRKADLQTMLAAGDRAVAGLLKTLGSR
ncbi:MAG: M20/M25/M40 family metallo-hydrolase, partial [Chloroflexi bacterium]|nr:M20/M25/M40 family metallo-hydrolase [Chloroflexota bacterium]